MGLQLSVAARNARLDAIETAIGTAPRLLIFTGAPPANCAAADPAGLLSTMVLPSDWLAAAASGSKAMAGSWAGTGSAAGVAASFRIKDTALTNCHIQGTVTITGSGGDMTLDNPNIANAQAWSVTGFTLNDANS
jgi:hypothetical protein